MPRAISSGREGAPLPLVSGEGFRVTATSSGRPSSDMSPPEPGRRAARRLFILRYLEEAKGVFFSAGEVESSGLNGTWSLTSPVLPENERRCSWRREDTPPSASCRDTCTFCTCCAEEAAERHRVNVRGQRSPPPEMFSLTCCGSAPFLLWF